MLKRDDRRSLRYLGAMVFMLSLVGCVIEPPQPPSKPAPVPGPVPPSPMPPSKPQPPAPKIYSGSYPDRIEANLRDVLAGTPVRLSRSSDVIKIILPGSAAFSANSELLQPRFTGVLDSIAQICRDYGKTAITIRGYTDSTGSFEHNQQLSERRAQSVGNYLIGHQIAASRIRTAGYGPRYPIADNQTDSGRAQNRRVEIELVPLP